MQFFPQFVSRDARVVPDGYCQEQWPVAIQNTIPTGKENPATGHALWGLAYQLQPGIQLNGAQLSGRPYEAGLLR
ncbi:TPA: hypothetical protein ACOVJJ_005892 [Klebsiella oxytoca]